VPDRPYQCYRRDTIRLPNRNYGKAGIYFVTICTHARMSFFGTVEGTGTHLSAMSQIAHDCWQAIPHHHPHVALDAFVVMPNHVHGLIHIVQAIDGRHTTTNQFGPLQKGALPAIVQSYKAAVTRQCRRQGMISSNGSPAITNTLCGGIDRCIGFANTLWTIPVNGRAIAIMPPICGCDG
jgi:putative transposase